MAAAEQFKVLVRLSLRSISTHRAKSFIVGGILAFGTFLLALNTTFLNNIEAAMERSVTRSLIGHAQVVSDQAKDDLAFFGPSAQSSQDLGVLPDFRKVRDTLKGVPGVQAVVPMGRDIATATIGNVIDQKLQELRDALKAGETDRAQKLQQRVRQLAELVGQDLEKRKAISSNVSEIENGLAVVARATSDAFWDEFAAAPEAGLEFLEGKLAPLKEDGSTLFLAYLGTDLDLFSKALDTFEIVEGTQVPQGERGFLFSHEVYEKQVKNGIAHQLDEIQNARKKDGKSLANARDTVLRENAAKVLRQYKRVIYELAPDESLAVERDLRVFLEQPKGELDGLVKELLTLTEATADARYEAFYKFVAPRIRLYSVKVGDTITLRAFSKSGYTRAQNLKVYGTFRFRGLDGSLLASTYNMMDLMSFRDLYGLMTPQRRKELDAMKAQVGVKEVSAENAEDALFGAEAAPASATTLNTEIAPEGDAKPSAQPSAESPRTFTQDDLDGGVVLNAAIVLADGGKLQPTIKALEEASKAAGLGLKFLDWQKAAGIIGQFILVMRLVLVIAFVIIFMPINILAGIGGMSEFSMMTKEYSIAWPYAYAAFLIGSVIIGWGTHLALKAFEARANKRMRDTKGQPRSS